MAAVTKAAANAATAGDRPGASSADAGKRTLAVAAVRKLIVLLNAMLKNQCDRQALAPT
jgi:hypothetical protein